MTPRHTRAGMLRNPFRMALITVLLALATTSFCVPGARAQSAPGEGPGGPILVVVDDANDANPFGRYYAEMLRAEGLNEFAVANVGALNAQTLSGYQVVILAETPLTAGQATVLDGWVHAGGNLIAMRPDARLAGLLGVINAGTTLSNAYLKVDDTKPPGTGVVDDTIQFHGTAARYALNGASSLATLYSDASSATSSPAVTLRSVGSVGGQAAAFSYDLARSVVYTRQGNPAWAGMERDGISPRRSDDLFFGGAADDWVDLDKVHIPQADEQQRLLANLITQMNLDRAPLPRFWYLPRGEKAAVIMTGDDHNSGGTPGQFDTFNDESPANCSVEDWECVRATSYVYVGSITDAQAGAYQQDGFEIGLHLNTGCNNFTRDSLDGFWADQLPDFRSAFPSVAPLRTNRTHCIAWSDWASEPIVEYAQPQPGGVRVRFDTNYYYWPGTWMLPRPGMFTGSGFPMRFADLDGSLIDVYQAATQLTDEWGGSQVEAVGVEAHINALLDRAVGADGYFGVFTANMHTDHSSHPGADAIVAAAQSRGVPVVSAVQMLEWLDGRNGSSFRDVSFNAAQLRFNVVRAEGARGLEAMVPASASTGALTALTRDGVSVSPTLRLVKGVNYVVFPATAGAYVATYGTAGGTPPGTPGPVPPTLPGPTTTGGTSQPPRQGTGSLGSEGNPTPADPTPTAPRARVMRHTTRVSADGIVRLQVRCPRSELRCRVDVRLRRGGRPIAKKAITLVGGRTTTVKLRLTRRARAQLARARSLQVKAVLRVTNGEASPVITTTRVRLLAPRWR
jgi:hypothetical protein